MITLIVYSKNRACQLNLLLESIKQYYYHLFDVHVIWKADSDYKQNYIKVIADNMNQVVGKRLSFYEETDIKQQTLNIIKTGSNFVGFAMDDSFFYRALPLDENDVNDLFFYHQIGCLSLRLGLNINREGPHELLWSPEYTYRKFFVWNFRRYGMSYFGYPFSLDGHIFKKEFLLNALSHIEWGIPNVIEAQLASKCVGLMPAFMACPQQSVLVTCPINRVQDLFPNKAGEVHGLTPEFLDQAYANGQRIDFNDAVKYRREVSCCHQELLFKLT